ncbi:hypothetical protein AURDEDRAFT_127285 [Auricularia subglabra TFB-10046 SS5]|nr:hypothetical protein AURDEDRAFT_127285 [Auricularia subglabra TFB-10046 SS5]
MADTTRRSLVELPEDALVQILASCPDFPTLAAAARTCKTLHNLCMAHPASILSNTVHTAAGSPSATAAALRVIRVEERLTLLAPTHGSASLEIAMLKTPETETLEAVFKARHFSSLTLRAAVAQRLEVHFSRALVNSGTEDVSMLTAPRSIAFQVAVHRLWLYCFLYSCRWMLAVTNWQNPRVRRNLFFKSFSALDKHNFMVVAGWMILVFERSRRGWIRSHDDAARQFMSIGPEGILEILDQPAIETFIRPEPVAAKMPWIIRDDDTSMTLSVGRRMLCSPGKLPSSPPEGTGSCFHCDTKTHQLYSQSNWLYGPHHLQLAIISNYLPGSLRRNTHELQLLHGHLGMNGLAAEPDVSPELRIKTKPSLLDHRFAQLILDLVGCDSAGDSFTAAGLAPHSLLCADCLELLVRSRLWLWFRVEKQAGNVEGYKAKPDCSDGYDCTLQRQKAHNRNYNHVAPAATASSSEARGCSRQ